MNDNYGISVIIDDTSTSREHDYTTFIYQLSAKKSRDKHKSDGELVKTRRWGMSILLSSETSILDACTKDKQGVRRRLLELRLEQGDLTKDAAQAAKLNKNTTEHYGLAGYKFVERLFAYKESIFDEIREAYEGYADVWNNWCKEADIKKSWVQALGEKAALIHVTCDYVSDFLDLEFDTEGIDNFLHELVEETIQSMGPSHSVDSHDEALALLHKLWPELKDLAISESKGYIHIPVEDFASFEASHGFAPKYLRGVFNKYGLTSTNQGRTDHTITFHDGDKHTMKVISIKVFEVLTDEQTK